MDAGTCRRVWSLGGQIVRMSIVAVSGNGALGPGSFTWLLNVPSKYDLETVQWLMCCDSWPLGTFLADEARIPRGC